ncbi:hypothetical protein KLP40_07845 [Hymenobacter sp. NST-14]|uniref:hypothetical protein n=1 Tax=Hymenobacter piscis TaxID=2839984 RepID=UPI001C0314CC|nr:hypothetical protein [Hymenobacter piscis]MBT9393072.1 hypothetical protein [Hymenobacter piscis]
MTRFIPLPLLAAALLTGSVAQAQTTQGTRVLGLSGGNFTLQRDDFATGFSGTLAPTAGVFVADNLALGVNVPFSYSRFAARSDEFRSRGLSVGLLPWLRYYLPSESRHRVFGELSVGGVLNSYRRKEAGYYGNGDQASTDTYLLASAGLGYSYFITPAVGLEALLAYQRNGGNSQEFGRGALGLSLGLRVYLPKN